MSAQKFPYPFDAEKVREMFAAVHWPVVDTDAMMAAQRSNLEAMMKANKIVAASCQALCERQIALCETAFAETRDAMAALQGEPMNFDQAEKSVEAMCAAFEKATTDFREMAEMAQKAGTDAFEVIRSRAEEAAAEFKATMEKAAA